MSIFESLEQKRKNKESGAEFDWLRNQELEFTIEVPEPIQISQDKAKTESKDEIIKRILKYLYNN